MYLPFYWALSNVKLAIRPQRKVFSIFGEFPTFTGKLRPLQLEIKANIINYLNKCGTCWLSLYTGGGKTFTAIFIACKIKLKTLIVCHRVNLINMWKTIWEMDQNNNKKFYFIDNIEKKPELLGLIGFV